MGDLLFFSTSASVSEVRGIAPEAMRVKHDDGVTTFVVHTFDADAVLSELARACHSVTGGHPRAFHSSPRAFASASSHLRVR